MDIYDKLTARIDELGFGFPKSIIRSDKRLMKDIFSEEDCADYLLMADGYQTAKQYAERNGFTEEVAKEKLDRMAFKGQIFRRHRLEGDEYAQHPFVLGILEWQVKNPRNQWLVPLYAYILTSKWGKRMSQTMPFYRSVPMRKEFVEGGIVMPYEDIEQVLDRHTKFAVGTCLCRLMDKMKPNNPCNHPMETCIMTDDYADFYVEIECGRYITKEETLAILREGEKDGRIINVTNSQEGENICSCCACGCGMLAMKKMFPGPSKDLWANYFSVIDTEKCVKCGACVKKCPFGILKKAKDGSIKIDTANCLGCGLCVSVCKKGALKLNRKPDDKAYTPPEKYEDAIEIWTKNTKKDYKKFK